MIYKHTHTITKWSVSSNMISSSWWIVKNILLFFCWQRIKVKVGVIFVIVTSHIISRTYKNNCEIHLSTYIFLIKCILIFLTMTQQNKYLRLKSFTLLVHMIIIINAEIDFSVWNRDSTDNSEIYRATTSNVNTSSIFNFFTQFGSINNVFTLSTLVWNL